MNESSFPLDQFLQFVVTVVTLGVGQPCLDKKIVTANVVHKSL